MNFIKEAQTRLLHVKSTNEAIKCLKEEFVRSTTSAQEAATHKKLRESMDVNSEDLHYIKSIIEGLKPEIEAAKSGPQDVETRLKITMHETIARQLQQSLAEADKNQMLYNEAARKKTVNQLRMVDAEIAEQTIEECLEDPHKVQQIMQEKIMGAAHGDVIRMVRDIEERAEDIKELERNIRLVHQMFLDLATLVHAQGEMLTTIEKHVDSAAEYVEKGNLALSKAKEHQKSARWKKCCLLCILLIVLLVIVIPAISFTAA